MDTALLEILACPKCKGELDKQNDPTGFVCHNCRLLFSVEDDIPNFLIDEAQALPPE